MIRIYAIFILCFSVTAHAANAEILKTVPSTNIQCSAELMMLTVGPSEEIKGSNNPNRLERMFRISNYVIESYLAVYIEEISVGEENSFSIYSTKRITSNMPGFMSEIKWLSPTQLEFKVAKNIYRMSNIDKSNIKLRLIKGN